MTDYMETPTVLHYGPIEVEYTDTGEGHQPWNPGSMSFTGHLRVTGEGEVFETPYYGAARDYHDGKPNNAEDAAQTALSELASWYADPAEFVDMLLLGREVRNHHDLREVGKILESFEDCPNLARLVFDTRELWDEDR